MYMRATLIGILLFAPALLLSSCKKENTVSTPVYPVKTVTLNSGDTLGESLKDADLPPQARNEIIGGLSKVFSPRRCQSGDRYEVIFDSNQWTGFNYYSPGLEYYSVERSTTGAVSARKLSRAAKKTIAAAQGAIRTSLWDAMSAQKLTPELIVSFADIFAWQIDFLTETRVGDSFKLIREKYVTADGIEIEGKILGAQYTASGTTYTALLYTNAKGQSDYYSPDGRSLRSAFLKAPLQYRRISSFFTKRRFHPILKYFRPHLGIDYAAPKGTPVSAIGEGTVTYAGWKGGNGKFITIRHANGYASYYGHLSRIGKGIRPGVRVHQGQVIGNVGSTGLSSGPHLDFRVSKDGRFLNFLTLRFPSAGTIGPDDANAFNEAKQAVFTDLAQIH